jgi:hypothetical protein
MYRRSVSEAISWFDPVGNGALDCDLYPRIVRRFLVYWCNKIVFEYRRRRTDMTRSAGPRSKATVAVFCSQRKHVKSNRNSRKATALV